MSAEQDQNGKGDVTLPQNNSLVARWYAVSRIKTPPFSGIYADVVRRTLRLHGCTLKERPDYVLVTFPAGTRKRASHLQTLHERYRVVLPDGYELYEIYMRQGWSVLALFGDG